MKIVCISGNHSRHLYYLNEISKKFEIEGSIIQSRENVLPTPPENISDGDRKNFIRHFQTRDEKEREYFGDQKYPNHDILETQPELLNSEKSVKFLTEKKPDVVLVFGSDLIKEPLRNHLPNDSINLHLGISPDIEVRRVYSGHSIFLNQIWLEVRFIIYSPSLMPVKLFISHYQNSVKQMDYMMWDVKLFLFQHKISVSYLK